eukprot:scaffold2428_cov412-Prasinococcus_capsulatus_cf.AAC.16
MHTPSHLLQPRRRASPAGLLTHCLGGRSLFGHPTSARTGQPIDVGPALRLRVGPSHASTLPRPRASPLRARCCQRCTGPRRARACAHDLLPPHSP